MNHATQVEEYDHVREHTAPHVNDRIDSSAISRIRYYAVQPREAVSQRIEELDREWDIERTLQANAATLALVGLGLGLVGRRGWLALPVVVASFLLLHSVQGWCPPVPVFRRLGVRTRHEIDREKYALKYLRGDFDDEEPGGEQDRASAAVHAVAV